MTQLWERWTLILSGAEMDRAELPKLHRCKGKRKCASTGSTGGRNLCWTQTWADYRGHIGYIIPVGILRTENPRRAKQPRKNQSQPQIQVFELITSFYVCS